MHARNPLAALAVAGLLVAAASPAPATAQDYYGEVRPILVENCVGCHTEAGPAWSMEDPSDGFRRRRAIAEVAVTRQMPPWLAAPGHQEYRDDLSLNEAEIATLRAWRDAGFPEGTPRPDPSLAGSREAVPFRTDASVAVLPEAAYLPNQESPDDYRCFLTEWTGERPTYLTGFRAVPGNRKVAHHVVVYAVQPELVDRFRELDDREEGLGYQCFGGALPDRLVGDRAARAAYEEEYPDGLRELDSGNVWLAHWAPGMDGYAFPEGTGVPLEPGTGLVVQMHYYSEHAPGESDTGTRLDFQVEPEVERPALHFSQTRGIWLAGERTGSMVIPPGKQATYEVANNLENLLGYIGFVTGVPEEEVQALEIHSANLHMHAFGHSGVIELLNEHGRHETLLEVPRWNLAWQRDFTFVEPFVLDRDQLGDHSLRVTCTYENPTAQAVYGGYGSYDEMCFNFSYIAVQRGPAATDDEEAARSEPR